MDINSTITLFGIASSAFVAYHIYNKTTKKDEQNRAKDKAEKTRASDIASDQALLSQIDDIIRDLKLLESMTGTGAIIKITSSNNPQQALSDHCQSFDQVTAKLTPFGQQRSNKLLTDLELISKHNEEFQTHMNDSFLHKKAKETDKAVVSQGNAKGSLDSCSKFVTSAIVDIQTLRKQISKK